MTTPDELQRVWRVVEAIPAINDLSAQYQNDIAEALLSKQAELLATVERLREELDVAAVHLQIAGGWLREAGDDGQRANELLRASNRARAALTTGEATTPNAGERR